MNERYDLVIEGLIFDWDCAKDIARDLSCVYGYIHVAIGKAPKKLREPNAYCVYASNYLDLLMAFMPGKPLAEWLEGREAA